MERENTPNENILVVDDDPFIRDLLREALEREGYRPEVSGDAEDALARSARKTFALAFVDINLPGMSGLDLAAEMKERNPVCEIVFITGSGSLENALRAIKIGAYDYLRKPFSLNDFLLCLKRFQERQLLRERIRSAERRYFRLVQNIPLIIYVLRGDFGLDFVSDAVLEILGYRPEEIVNRPGWLLERVPESDRERLKAAFQAAFERGAPVSLECRLLRSGRDTVHVLLKSIPGPGGKSRLPHAFLEGFILDITDRVILEKTLIQREKLETLGAISAEVAHEIRNPLVSIGGFARRLKQKYPTLGECDVILRESQRLESILSRITNYLRPVEIHPQKCSINGILQECLERKRPQLEERGLGLRLEFQDSLPLVFLDPEILTQVFVNLIQSALESMDRSEELTITTSREAGEIHVRIKGRFRSPGTPDDKTIFMPFSVESSRGGVPLSYRLVKDIGGILYVREENGHRVFTVSLPLVDTRTGQV
ncbi:MAG: response regulator [Deltaproteobacteria bacterium]|nr:response regulator [Deltaproteobacteria bacterium]